MNLFFGRIAKSFLHMPMLQCMGKHKHLTWWYEEKNMHQIFLLFTTTEKGLIKSGL